MNKFMTRHLQIGNIGENVALKFLETKGYVTIERNYSRKWGEIDIIMKKGNVTHFVEVKAISHENTADVSRKTGVAYRPEDNLHPKKLERLHRIIETYLLDRKVTGDWQLDLVAVELFIKDKVAQCRLIDNVL